MSVLRLRHVADVNPPTPEFDRAGEDTEVPFVPLDAVWSSGVDLSRVRPKWEVSQGYTRFREGDVLVPKITPTFEADRTTIARGLHGGFGAGTTELHVVRCRPGTDRRYIRYLLSSRQFLRGGQAEMTGVAGQKRVPDSWLRDVPVTVASVQHQRAIADFLDIETERFDAVRSRKRQLGHLLLARWIADLCSTLLPGGLDPASAQPRPYRRWEIRPLKRLIAKFWGGDWGQEPGEGAVDLPCVRAADFDFVRLSAVHGALRSFSVDSAASRSIQSGDLVIEKSGGGEDAPVGRVVAWRGVGRAIPTNFAGGLRPRDDVDDSFVLLALRAAYEVGLPRRSIKQTTGLQNLDLGHYLSHRWPVPPLRDQRKIVADLLAEHARVLAVQEKLRQQLALLHEHREALITAAVTGEVDIPGVAP